MSCGRRVTTLTPRARPMTRWLSATSTDGVRLAQLPDTLLERILQHVSGPEPGRHIVSWFSAATCAAP